MDSSQREREGEKRTHCTLYLLCLLLLFLGGRRRVVRCHGEQLGVLNHRGETRSRARGGKERVAQSLVRGDALVHVPREAAVDEVKEGRVLAFDHLGERLGVGQPRAALRVGHELGRPVRLCGCGREGVEGGQDHCAAQ